MSHKCPKHPEFRAESCYYCLGESEMTINKSTIQEKENKVTELATKYYNLIGKDHHKDRDCHFYIEKVAGETKWSYGSKTINNLEKYRVIHYGYVNELKEVNFTGEFVSETHEFDLYESALDFLITNLERMTDETKDDL